MKIHFGAALSALLVGVALIASQAASAEPLAAELPSTAHTAPRFNSILEAVTAGRLDQQVATELRRDGSVDAIVLVDERAPDKNLPRSLRARADALEHAFAARKSLALAPAGKDIEILRTYENLPSTFVRFESEEALLDVLNTSTVQRVRANASVPLDTLQSLSVIKQPEAAAAGRVGTGTFVAVLDTGVDYTRSPFGCTAPSVPSTCKVALSTELDGDTETYLDEGNLHGTNVAGIVASVAPGARILAYDIFDWKWNTEKARYELRSDYDDQLAAMNDVIERKRAGLNIVAINMSLGGGHYTSSCNAGLNFSTARSLGIVPVVAAGNDRFVKNVFTPGIAAPACDPNAISVGATTDSAHASSLDCDSSPAVDRITGFSQTASILTMLAPGQCIYAAGIPMQGTSQAAPHVAGAVAVLASAKYGSNLLSRTGADAIADALRDSGPSIYDSLSGVSRKRLDLQASLQTLLADTTPPTVSFTSQVIPSVVTTSGSAVDSQGRVPVRASWTASDAGTGLAALDVEYSVNGTWYQLSTPSATQTSATVWFPTGSTSYQFRVAAKDGAGNWSPWVSGPTFKLTLFQEDNALVSFGGTWTRLAWSVALGGYEKSANQAGATARLRFTGRNVAWIAPTQSDRGRASISVDGALWGTRDLYSASTLARAVAFSYYWPSPGEHTIEVKVEGTAGRPNIDVDAFVVMS